MELMLRLKVLRLKDQAPHAFPRGAFPK